MQVGRVELRKSQAERPLLGIKGMRRVAELDEFELLDHVGIIDRDLEVWPGCSVLGASVITGRSVRRLPSALSR